MSDPLLALVMTRPLASNIEARAWIIANSGAGLKYEARESAIFKAAADHIRWAIAEAFAKASHDEPALLESKS